MNEDELTEAAFARAEAAFERAVSQTLSAREADFQKLAEQVLGDFASLAIERILDGVGGSETPASSGAAISTAIARAAANGGRFL